MPEAEPDDVRVEIDTRLDDLPIQKIIDRVSREWQRHYNSDAFDNSDHIQDFEAVLTALRIAEGRDRRAEEVQTGRTSKSYETSEVDSLRKRVRRLDPGSKFGHASAVVRDNNRHITSTDL